MGAGLPLAVAAALAYLNARGSLWYDGLLVRCALRSAARVLGARRRGRLNLFYVLEERALSAASAGRDMVRFEGRSLTYGDGYARVLRYGAWLRHRLAVQPRDIVAVVMANSDRFVVVWWALWSVGARPAFVNPQLGGQALAHCLRAAAARLCLADADLAPGVAAAVAGAQPGLALAVVSLTPAAAAEAEAQPAQRAPDAARQADDVTAMAMLIFTSGTTGLPKPAVVAWAKCIVGASFAETLLQLAPADVVYTAMPLYHSAAAVLSVCACVSAGCTQALGRRFSASTFWAEATAAGATHVQYVGETLRYLLAAPPRRDPASGAELDRRHRVRCAFGNGLRPDVWAAFRARFAVDTIVEFYAATEGPFAAWNVSRNAFAAGAVGRPGELLVRLSAAGPDRRFQGYFADADAAKLLRDVFAPGDVWFRTGDVLRRDADGRFFFSDRIGDTFRWKAENVSTADVSQALGTHPAVREANVYGVRLPHHEGRAALPSYARPLFLRLVPDVGAAASTTATNKQQKHALHEPGVRPEPGTYWLRADAYVPFAPADWQALQAGRLKL